ncbi:MalY/PatB family protein [Sellimonas catena]|uniref:cysteine-S-conjugate beta-lyase n=1 Tax=Sellimonas catena TaxID=2994035 RepID=A0A9W6CL49_9FIRM|nr:aminotransferase class I/II-fold pyridoxal phosphate-dependent enzyme [Sellimonas catena]GLG91798.1 aminotransferase [Sellimonas catena]
MKYDFTSIMDRRGKDAIAVDLPGNVPAGGFAPGGPKEGFDLIPMWVADMNFPTAPSIIEEVKTRLEHPAFGYFNPSDAYFDAIINWHKERKGVEGLTKEDIGYENGVLGGLVSALNAFASHGDPILVHSPTYIGFTNSIEGAGYKIVHSLLKQDEEGVWRMDYEDMDAKIKANKIHVAVFCNPHNPTGRVWEPEEIEKAMEVYKANDCIVISDEIWSDLILEGYHHTPTQSVSEDAKNRTIALYAPSKTFNLAGLIGSYHVIYNSYLRDRVVASSSKCHYNSMNVLSMHALVGAYRKEGAEWVDELRQVLSGNVDYAYDYIKEHFEGVNLSKPQGTYMLFLDCEEWCKKHGKTVDELLKAGWDVGVAWQDGRPFHGEYCIRMNLALPFSRVQEAFRRLDEYVF